MNLGYEQGLSIFSFLGRKRRQQQEWTLRQANGYGYRTDLSVYEKQQDE